MLTCKSMLTLNQNRLCQSINKKPMNASKIDLEKAENSLHAAKVNL